MFIFWGQRFGQASTWVEINCGHAIETHSCYIDEWTRGLCMSVIIKRYMGKVITFLSDEWSSWNAL